MSIVLADDGTPTDVDDGKLYTLLANVPPTVPVHVIGANGQAQPIAAGDLRLKLLPASVRGARAKGEPVGLDGGYMGTLAKGFAGMFPAGVAPLLGGAGAGQAVDDQARQIADIGQAARNLAPHAGSPQGDLLYDLSHPSEWGKLAAQMTLLGIAGPNRQALKGATKLVEPGGVANAASAAWNLKVNPMKLLLDRLGGKPASTVPPSSAVAVPGGPPIGGAPMGTSGSPGPEPLPKPTPPTAPQWGTSGSPLYRPPEPKAVKPAPSPKLRPPGPDVGAAPFGNSGSPLPTVPKPTPIVPKPTLPSGPPIGGAPTGTTGWTVRSVEPSSTPIVQPLAETSTSAPSKASTAVSDVGGNFVNEDKAVSFLNSLIQTRKMGKVDAVAQVNSMDVPDAIKTRIIGRLVNAPRTK